MQPKFKICLQIQKNPGFLDLTTIFTLVSELSLFFLKNPAKH